MSAIRRHLSLTVLACLSIASSVFAQQAGKPDDARFQAARQVLVASGAVEAMVAVIKASIPEQRAATPQLPAEFWTRFEARVVQGAPELADSIAMLYAGTFSLADLQGLVAFYQSPLGQRFRAAQVSLLRESSAVGQRWGARLGSEIAAGLNIR